MLSFALWQIIELSGYTTRVSEMFEVFEEVQQGHCQRQAIKKLTERRDSIDEAEEPSSEAVGVHGEVVDLSQMSGGEVVDTEGSIALKDVAIITPCGDVVVSSLSFEVSRYYKGAQTLMSHITHHMITHDNCSFLNVPENDKNVHVTCKW